jgi:ABC-type amino acid transport substrate-binding protein
MCWWNDMSLLRCALFVLAGALLSLPASAKTWTEVRLGVSANYPPFSSLDEHNRFKGFEIDLARALCERMEVSCVFVKQDWEDMIPALLSHRFDAIFASMSITDERRKKIAFSNRYYQTPTAFVARKAINLRDASPAGMERRVIGAQEATVQAQYLREVFEPAGAIARFYATQPEAQFDLARGQLDAILVDKLSVYDWLKTDQGKCCGYAGP